MILAIVGPTGVGKTKLSIYLAKKYKAIVVNADAMQIYTGMDIGTSKIKESEKEGIPHFLFDIRNVEEDYTVYDYQKDARKIIAENSDKNIIFVGGSGLYLKAALYNYVFSDELVHNDYNGYSNEELYDLALKKDPKMNIHLNNRKRLVRFLNKEREVNEPCELLYDVIFIALTLDRNLLYERIDKRVDEMFADSLVEEVRSFYNKRANSKALNTAIGYKELFKYFDNEISLEEAKDLIKKNSRHYAKRQYTWINNQMDVTWFKVNIDDFSETIKNVCKYIDERKG